jgi:hypothetical protein
MIKLDKDYTLKPDAASWNLHYAAEGEINPATGRPSLSENAWFHSNLHAACMCYVDQRAKDATTVQGILDSIEDSTQRIEEALRGVATNFRLGVKADENS